MSAHIAPKSIYFLIFGVLMILTSLTVGVAFVDLGPLNTIVALGIAFLKATLVVLFFMHLKYSNRLTALFFASGVIWLGIMFVHSLSDYLARGMVGPGK